MAKARHYSEDELRRRVAGNLARLLKKHGMDERGFAEALGWTEPSVAHGAANLRKYLRAEKWPREETLLRWGELLGVDPAEFIRPV